MTTPAESAPTLPAIEAAPTYITPGGMPAMTLEYRLGLLEAWAREQDAKRPGILAELRAEMASIRQDNQAALALGLAEEAKERKALEARFTALADELKADVSAVRTETTEQTTMLKGLVTDVATIMKSFAGVFASPRVRTYAMTILGSLAALSTVAAAYLKGHEASPPTPPAITTVYVPAPAPSPIIYVRPDGGIQ